MKGFSGLFICHKTDSITKCGQFLSGLLHDCKSNMERIVERVLGSDYDQIQHFISNSPWDSFGLMDTVSEKVQETLCNCSNTEFKPSQGLILDESGWEKSGKKSVAQEQVLLKVNRFIEQSPSLGLKY